jgi:hypothetical protein
MKQRRRKGIRAVILALATAAILVPAASGHVYEGGSTGYVTVDQPSGYTAQALKAMNARWTAIAQSYQHARPDDREGFRGVAPSGPSSDYVDRQLANLVAKAALVAQAMHVDDRAGIRGPGPVETATVVSSHGDGFDWTDAGIGASVALLAAAMLAAATMTRRRAGLAV